MKKICTSNTLLASFIICSLPKIGGVVSNVDSIPIGHGDILGKHRPPEGHIDVWTNFPTPQEFWQKYASQRKPALFRGAANQFPALKLWTDDYLGTKFGSLEVKLEHKFEKNNVPVGARGLGRDTIASFLETYKDKASYIVSQLPDPMSKDVSVLPFLTCGSFYERLLEANLWLSSGGTKSLLHRDADNAFNCLLNGTKDWVLIDPKHEDKIPIAEGDIGYGGFAVLDVDKVNLIKYKKFQGVPWYYANVTAGDCLFLPYGYWHQVRSYGSKNMAVSMLFSRLTSFNDSGCNQSLDYIPLSESGMIWTYPGYGPQTLGNPDPFETRDSFLIVSSKKKKVYARDLVNSKVVNNDDDDEGDTPRTMEEALKFAEKVINILDVDKKGFINRHDVTSATVSQWKKVAGISDNDPANTDYYEHFTINFKSVKDLILEAIDPETKTLGKDVFIHSYMRLLGGSERWGKDLFTTLGGDSQTEAIPEDIVKAKLPEVLKLFTKQEDDRDTSGYYYQKHLKEDKDIMKKMGISDSDNDFDYEVESMADDDLIDGQKRNLNDKNQHSNRGTAGTVHRDEL